MKNFFKNKLYMLISIILLVLTFKLLISLSTDLFTESSYFHLRQAEFIKGNLLPSIDDPLSYQGREYQVTPLFYYLIAFIPDVLKKILVNTLMASTSLIIYFLVKHLVKNKNIALLSALISLFIPATAILTNSTLSPLALLCPLFAFFMLSYAKRDQWSSWPIIITIILMILTSSISFFFVLGFGAYFGLLRIKNLKPAGKDIEILMFFLFSAVWFFSVIFKDNLQGLNFLWGNTPQELIYDSISTADLFSSIGLLPLLLALIGANEIFEKKSRNQLMILSMALVIILGLLFGMMPLVPGLALLGILCSVISGLGLRSIKQFSKRTKYSLNKVIIPFLVIVFLSTTFIPFVESNISEKIPSNEKMEAVYYLVDVEGTVISSPAEAHLIMYFSGRKTYYDNYYAFSNAPERYKNSIKIYAGNSIFEAGKVLTNENIKWIFFSEETKEFYGVKELKIFTLGNCIVEKFEGEVIVFENRCRIT